MKAVKKLKVLLVVLLILLVSLISFGGIYYLSKGKMLNRVKDYQLSSELKGYRQITLLADSSSSESSTNESSDENSVDENNTDVNSTEENITDENATDENATDENATEEENDNSESKYTTSDYKKAADAIRGRLKSLKVENYDVALDNATGKITIKIPENDDTDSIVSDINVNGKFTIIDSDTNEELINNDDVKSVKVATYTSSYSSTATKYMQINFNNKGARKLKNITATYQNTIKEENVVNETNSTSDNETSNEIEATENQTTENETDQNETTENETTGNETSDNETSDNTTQGSDRKVIIKIDDTELITTDFSEIIDNGSLVLTMGSSDDSSNLISERSLAAIIENEPLNVTYTIEGNTFVSSIIEDNSLKVIIYSEIIIALIISLYIVLKYRKNGIFAVVLSIGYIATLLLIIRITNVKISLNGILAVLITFIINAINEIIILKEIDGNKDDLSKKQKNKLIKETFTKQLKVVIPILAIAIVSLFSSWSEIFSLGMVLFWGVIISLIYNWLITEFLL